MTYNKSLEVRDLYTIKSSCINKTNIKVIILTSNLNFIFLITDHFMQGGNCVGHHWSNSWNILFIFTVSAWIEDQPIKHRKSLEYNLYFSLNSVNSRCFWFS